MPDVRRKYLNAILNEINEPEIGSMIHLTGYVPNNELVYIYNHASVFLYPSHYESFGIPLLEAMATGIPVISSAKAAIPEIAGDAAILVDPRDSDAIQEAITYLLQNESKRLELREKGLKRAFSFNWGKTAKATLDVYVEILAKNSKLVENLILQ
jgi:glycosyltransferase involved in cell wall biosynthesis